MRRPSRFCFAPFKEEEEEECNKAEEEKDKFLFSPLLLLFTTTVALLLPLLLAEEEEDDDDEEETLTALVVALTLAVDDAAKNIFLFNVQLFASKERDKIPNQKFSLFPVFQISPRATVCEWYALL